ncbi:hypothetical protein AAC387_Pa01g3964 [Persea americana]
MDHQPWLLSEKVPTTKIKTPTPLETHPSLTDLRYDVITEILQKTQTPMIDTSNLFSIVDSCSFTDPALNPSYYGRNLQTTSEGTSSTGPPPGFEHHSDTSDTLASQAAGKTCALSSTTKPKPAGNQGKSPRKKGIQATTDMEKIQQTEKGKKPLQAPSIGPITRRSRDLWCISKSSSQFSTTLSDSSSQHISMLLTNQISGLSTQIIGVYGANKPTLRKDLWKVLIDSSSTTLPWCVMGDFNAILTHEEKQSLRQSTPSSLKDFQLAVLQAGLKDIQYSGSRFTWSNNRQRLSYVAARLDRVLVNSHSIDT